MTKRWTGWLAVSLWTVSLIVTSCALALMYANGGPVGSLELIQIGIILPAIMSLSTVGALLAVHRHDNPLGWIFLVAGLSFTVFPPADEYAQYITETAPGSLPDLTVLFWLAAWIWIPAFFAPATFGILLFPTGRLPSPRWRPFAWAVGILLSVVVLADMLEPGPMLDPPDTYPQFTNPIGVESIDGLLGVVLAYGELALFGLLLGAAASILTRLKTASGVERQQIKWFALAATVPITGFLIYLALLTLPAVDNRTANDAGGLIVAFGTAMLPVAVGIAILKHNLYDIDRLINRTMVYGSLTLLLVLGFAGTVLLFQIILSPITSGNDVAVAGSTLLVFALFRPLRDRLQFFVDRRFYRRKYNAERTLEIFAGRLRDEFDLDTLRLELQSIVDETVQPEHVVIWLRSELPGERQ